MNLLISDNEQKENGPEAQPVPGEAAKRTARKRIRHHESFLLHMRPREYRAETVSFFNTYYLGFLSVFFLLLECFTGLVLMVYYIPTPEQAYGSIIRLTSEIPFGWLLRDLHRLGGECMIVVVMLHLIRVFGAGVYRDKARFTWFTGVVLLLCTLLLAFTGYLLPWDQLAFWAVMIGTGMAEAVPGIGRLLTPLLRGGSEFGQDGLLRFYLLHIMGLPLVMILFTSIHYYRVSRLHGAPLSIGNENIGFTGGDRKKNGDVKLFPSVILLELSLSLALLSTLLITVLFFYDAPLGNHADPNHTPVSTRAPWFFVWLQGALKVGDSLIFGICLPAGLLALLLAVPYLDQAKQPKKLKNRPISASLLGLLMLLFSIMTVVGLPSFGRGLDPVGTILQHINPEEQESYFHRLGYDNIPRGIYDTSAESGNALSGPFKSFFKDFSAKVNQLAREPHIFEAGGIVLVEDWQENLKKITVRIQWSEKVFDDQRRGTETIIYLYRNPVSKGPAGMCIKL